MTILLTGGGTGGHITPLLAVASELKRQHPDCRIVYVGEKQGAFRHLTEGSPVIDETYSISAGKFRRYHGEGLLRRLLDVHTNVLNARDSVRVLRGYVQARQLLRQIKPDVVFLKGGFVGVPLGIAAAKLQIPLVTHDSDELPGLANRLVARWATIHAVAQPVEGYSYPPSKTRRVGVLVEPSFTEVTQSLQDQYRKQLGIPIDALVLLVTGGSSGAQRLNEAVINILGNLLEDYVNLYVIHQVGKAKGDIYGSFKHDRLQVHELMRPMYVYTGAADVVVARASANTVAELGVQKKPVIVVANPFLSDGHQLENARRLEEQGLALSVSESAHGTDEAALDAAIRGLLNDKEKRLSLATSLHDATIQDAASQMAKLLLEVAKKHQYVP